MYNINLAEQIAVEFLVIDPFIAARRNGLMQVVLRLFLQTASERVIIVIYETTMSPSIIGKTIKYFKLGVDPTRTFALCGFLSFRRISFVIITILATKTFSFENNFVYPCGKYAN